MKNYIKSLFAVAVLSASATAYAQNTETGYFNENFLYRHELNPAFENEKGYVAMPFLLGNMNLGLSGNIGLTDLLYNTNGQTVTFMHPSVSKDEVLSSIKNNNKIGENLKYQLIGVGFKAFKGYNTISLNLRQDLNMALPGDAFRLAKEGISNKTYDLTGLNMNMSAYMELALGHSHKINEHWKVGGKFKFLIGGGNIDLITNNAQVILDANGGATAVMNAELHGNVKGLEFKHDYNENTGKEYVSGFNKINNPGLGGFGFAFDLGAEYKLDDHFKFSLAFLDLGLINWKNDYLVTTDGERSVNSNNYTFNVDKDAPNSFSEEGQRMSDDFAELYQLEDKGDQGSRCKALGATMNVGVDYTFHYYDKLHFGLLNTTRINGKYSWTDFRLSANVKPVKWFTATAALTMGTYGVGFGWMLDFQPKKGFDLFLAMDRTPGKLAKQGIPLNYNADISLGIGFTF